MNLSFEQWATSFRWLVQPQAPPRLKIYSSLANHWNTMKWWLGGMPSEVFLLIDVSV
jgi:hypothetical protein